MGVLGEVRQEFGNHSVSEEEARGAVFLANSTIVLSFYVLVLWTSLWGPVSSHVIDQEADLLAKCWWTRKRELPSQFSWDNIVLCCIINVSSIVQQTQGPTQYPREIRFKSAVYEVCLCPITATPQHLRHMEVPCEWWESVCWPDLNWTLTQQEKWKLKHHLACKRCTERPRHVWMQWMCHSSHMTMLLATNEAFQCNEFYCWQASVKYWNT